MAKDFVLRIGEFLGLSSFFHGSASLPAGASPNMLNFKVTERGHLKKRGGFVCVYSAEEVIRGFWAGKVGEGQRYLAVIGNSLYASSDGFDSLQPLSGEVPGEERVTFVPFYDRIYLLTGCGIRYYDGTELNKIEPYVPLVMISTVPGGAGTPYEEPNILTNRIRQSFSPTGEDTVFYPALDTVYRVHRVTVKGNEVSSDNYYWDAANCCLVLKTAPPKGTDTMEVLMELYQEDASDRIQNCRFAVGFGGANDTRVFLYGNRDTPAMRYHSGVVDGKPSFAYFPETGYSLVGSGAPITAILRHYDRQLIFTENAAYYSYLEYITGDSGRLIAAFPILPLSDDRGCAPEGQALLVDNAPCTLTDTGLFQWTSTNVRDERNAQNISDPIACSLQKEDASKAILFHRKATSELFLCFGSHVYVYNRLLDLFYYYRLPEIGGFCEVETQLYFFTQEGIFRVEGDLDDGEAIPAHWESGTLDFSDAAREKNVFGFTLLGETPGETAVQVEFSEENGEKTKKVSLSLPEGRELSSGFFRLPLRRIRLLKLKLSTAGEGAFLLRGLRVTGRITEK